MLGGWPIACNGLTRCCGARPIDLCRGPTQRKASEGISLEARASSDILAIKMRPHAQPAYRMDCGRDDCLLLTCWLIDDDGSDGD